MFVDISKVYDSVVIGAGIAGCCMAHALSLKGHNVLLLDRSSAPASGGSGAAGAFVSPKIGKGSPLQTLTNQSFEFAKDFYLTHFPEYFHQSGVIRIPKDDEDADKFSVYKEYIDSDYAPVSSEEMSRLGISDNNNGFLFSEAGVCDAQGMCNAICNRLNFMQFDVKNINFSDGVWHLYNHENELKAKNIVLATGHENDMFDMRYMAVHGTWGSRGDYMSSLSLDISMHKKISISANRDGIIKLGATHVKAKEPCLVCDGKPLASLEQQARDMVNTDDFVLKETFCGMRAGSKDYFPLAGKVIDVPYMLERYPKILKGAKPPIKYIDNLYICNGMGGRGFVFAPLMAECLSDLIVTGNEIDSRVNPDRLFLKWCRKLGR